MSDILCTQLLFMQPLYHIH